MRTKQEITIALNSIRTVLDQDVHHTDIEALQAKLTALTHQFGLSSECKASAKKLLHLKELDVLTELNLTDLQASIVTKMLTAKTADEIAILEYADRINASITHTCDSIRSIISLYKEELKNQLNG